MSTFPDYYIKDWFNDKQRMLISNTREFVEKEIFPRRTEIDDDKDHKKHIEPILKKWAEMGMQCPVFPPEYGGMGVTPDDFSFPTQLAITEEFGRGDSGICMHMVCTWWAAFPMIMANNTYLMEKYGPMLAGKELKTAGYNMTEPHGGCNQENRWNEARGIRTTVKKDGNEWVVNGEKMWASNVAIADLVLVLCNEDYTKGRDGLAHIFHPSPHKGVTYGKWERKAGYEGDVNAAAFYDDLRVPLEYRASGPDAPAGTDADLHDCIIMYGRPFNSAMMVGQMQAVLELVLDFTKDRTASGKIQRNHSMVAGIIADMAAAIEHCRTYYLWMGQLIQNLDSYKPGETHTGAWIMGRAAASKVFTGDMCVMVMNKAIELTGSYGYTRDYYIEKYWRDSKINQIVEGGAQLGRLDTAAGWYDLKPTHLTDEDVKSGRYLE